MKFLEAILLAVICWFLAASLGWAQCGADGCSIQAWNAWAAARGEYQWAKVQGQPEYAALYQGHQQIGVYNFRTGFYQRKLAGGWSGPARAPIVPPFGGNPDSSGSQHFGLQMKTLPAGEKIWCGTTVYSHAEAAELIEADLRDDAKAPHVTVIDRDAGRRKKLLEDLAVSKWKGEIPEKARLQVYDPTLRPNKFMLAPFRLEQDQEFQKNGCVVIAQKAADQVKGQSHPERLYGNPSPPMLVEALRTVDPSYDPSRPIAPFLPFLQGDLFIFLAVAGVLLLILGVAIGRGKQ